MNHSLDDVFAKNQNSRERETSGRTTYILTLQVSYMWKHYKKSCWTWLNCKFICNYNPTFRTICHFFERSQVTVQSANILNIILLVLNYFLQIQPNCFVKAATWEQSEVYKIILFSHYTNSFHAVIQVQLLDAVYFVTINPKTQHRFSLCNKIQISL